MCPCCVHQLHMNLVSASATSCLPTNSCNLESLVLTSLSIISQFFSLYNIVSLCKTVTDCYYYTPPHNSGGILWFHVGRPWVRPSVRPSVRRTFVRFSFPDDNLSKHQWIFIKLGICNDIVEIWLGIANGQISSIFDGVICPYFRFRTITWVNNKGFSPNLLYALTLRRSGLGLLMCKFRQFFTELSARDTSIFSFLDDNLSK